MTHPPTHVLHVDGLARRIGVICPGLQTVVRDVAARAGVNVVDTSTEALQRQVHGVETLHLDPTIDDALDCVWIVTRADEPLPDKTAATLTSLLRRERPPQVHLALVHRGPARATWRWLQALHPTLHLHIRDGSRADLDRWARHLCGEAVALVLGAGGARGFAHLGAWRAVHEAGIPIDVVAGASMGAVLGCQIAAGWDVGVATARSRDVFLARGGFKDHHVPGLSLIDGGRLARRLQTTLGPDRRIEDLPLPFAATTVTLRDGRVVTHRTGVVWRTVVASGSLPGMAPPIELDGELHVDGGMLDALPVTAAKLPGVGHVLAVDALPQSTRALKLPRHTGVRLLWSRFRPGGDRRALTLPDVLQRAMSFGARQSVAHGVSQASLTLRPELSGFAVTDARPFDKIVHRGYADAHHRLSAWTGPRGQPLPVTEPPAPPPRRRQPRQPAAAREVSVSELTTSIDTPAGPFQLPQHCDPVAQRARHRALQDERERYVWEEEPGLPPYARGLPTPEKLHGRKALSVFGPFAIGAARGVGLHGLLAVGGRNQRTFSRMHKLGRRAAPISSSQWMRDGWFAQQRLAGNNPVVIERCAELPDHFRVDESVARSLMNGQTPADAAAQGRLFLCDYRMLKGLARVPGRYVADAMALFWVDDDGALQPVAIQLGQDPSQALTFTPRDTLADWTLAKLHVQCADGNHHQWVSHLLLTHYALDPWITATRRQLPCTHPLYELLRPHLRWTLAINHVARESVAGNKGTFARMKSLGTVGGYPLANAHYARYSFLDDELEAQLTRRGVGDGLPTYHFRDDARATHDALRHYVDKMLRLFYPRPELLQQDVDVHRWIQELRSSGQVRGLPERFERVQDLAPWVHALISRVTVWHEAVSGWQYEGYMHVPNMPHGLWAPAPTQRGQATWQHVLDALPPRDPFVLQMVAGTITPPPNQSTLLRPHSPQFVGCPEAQAVRASLNVELRAIGHAIARRNTARAHPYRVLDPNRIAESIEV